MPAPYLPDALIYKHETNGAKIGRIVHTGTAKGGSILQKFKWNPATAAVRSANKRDTLPTHSTQTARRMDLLAARRAMGSQNGVERSIRRPRRKFADIVR